MARFTQEMLEKALSNAINNIAKRYYEYKRGSCSVSGCPNDKYAKGMCQAHYARKAKGKSIDAPLRIKQSGKCIVCGEQSYGNSLCNKHYRADKKKKLKRALVDAMGGVCAKCGKAYPLCVFDFHHVDGKDVRPAKIISQGNIKAIASELSKCILLCANCHRIEHHGE